MSWIYTVQAGRSPTRQRHRSGHHGRSDRQETIVGAMLLTLAPGDYRLDYAGPRGVARNSLLDQVDIYPQLQSEAAR